MTPPLSLMMKSRLYDARIKELEQCLRDTRRQICEHSSCVIFHDTIGTTFDNITAVLGDGETIEVDRLINGN